MGLEYLDKLGRSKEDVKQVASTPLGDVVKKFAQEAIDQMREEAPSASGTLKSSIGFDFVIEDGALKIVFYADDYWDYLNSGVDGVEQSAGAIANQFGSTYSYKTLNPSKKMVDAFAGRGSMQNWLASKGITTLKFGGMTKQLITDADYRGAAYVLARATKRHGIKPTPFVNNALSEEKIQEFEQRILDAFENMI